MASNQAQNYANHVKFDPPFHFFLAPIAVINVIVASIGLYRNPNLDRGWILVLSITALVAIFKMRVYSLKVQDRVIRLEERLRMSALLPEPLRSRIGQLTEGQIVALRFASDAEVPALVEKALAANLKNSEIKKAIVGWRPDYFRV